MIYANITVLTTNDNNDLNYRTGGICVEDKAELLYKCHMQSAVIICYIPLTKHEYEQLNSTPFEEWNFGLIHCGGVQIQKSNCINGIECAESGSDPDKNVNINKVVQKLLTAGKDRHINKTLNSIYE